MPITLDQDPEISAGDVDVVSVSAIHWLDEGELLTGIPTVVEITTAALTLGNKQINTTALTILGREVAIGQAVLFSVTGQVAGVTYRVRVTATTDGGGPTGIVRTFVRDILLAAK